MTKSPIPAATVVLTLSCVLPLTATEPIDIGSRRQLFVDRHLIDAITDATMPYRRAEGLYLMFPSRYADTRKSDPAWKYPGVNDIVLLSSRDGIRFDRTFMESFVRPGLDQGNWHDRSIYMERGILQTSPTEMSMYAMENWRLDTVALRKDAFIASTISYLASASRSLPDS